MNKKIWILWLAVLCGLPVLAQTEQHYTMFMYNKLLYNPGYAGSRDVLSVNALYRKQWSDVPGAPRSMSAMVDAPVGNYMRPFRPVAVGLSIGDERMGVEKNTSLRAYYAYRIQMKKSVLSGGLSGGGSFYSATYSDLVLMQQQDPNFSSNISNVFLPNFGAGVYWYGERFYGGLSVPNMLQNYYDKDQVVRSARQIRTFYASGGYVFPINDEVKLQPQVLVRYAKGGGRALPMSSDFNLSAVLRDRLLVGFTYRTDKSMEGIVHMQVTERLNLGYAYDYMSAPVRGYIGGSHELVMGFDLYQLESKFHTPRFIKSF